MSQPDISDLMSVIDAAAAIDAAAPSPRVEAVALGEVSGRRLAEDVAADADYPLFDRALMDGYAAVVGEPAGEFEVVGDVPAGRPWAGEPLIGRKVVSIMTGAPLPAGNVGVVPVERTAKIGENRVRIDAVAVADKFITRRGGDRPAGSVLLRRGTLLGPHHAAALATVGRANVPVFCKPRCAVLSTGDEIVAAHETPGVGQVRNANAPLLLALLTAMGGDAVDAGHVADDLDATRHRLGDWLDSSADALFVTGGMSMGDRDFVPRVLRELGAAFHVSKLAVKPGKPFVFATLTRERGFVSEGGATKRDSRTTAIFGLPGNPVSAFVCALVLSGRWLLRSGGATAEQVEARFTERPLADDLPATGPRQFYQPAVFESHGVRPLAWRGSADVFTLAAADALIERPAGDAARAAGQAVRVIALPGGTF